MLYGEKNQPEAAAISNSTRSGTRPGRLLGISMAVVRPIGTRLLTSGSMVRTQLGEPLFLVTGSIATAPCGGGHDYSRGFGLSSINFGSNAPAQTIQTSAGKRASGSRIIAGRNTSPSDDSSATAATTRPEIIVQRCSRRDRPAVSKMPARRRPRGTMCPKPPVASAKAECARRRGHQDQAGHEQDGEGRRLKTRLLARTYDLQLASCCTGCDGCPSAPSRIDGGAHFTLGPVAKARRVVA